MLNDDRLDTRKGIIKNTLLFSVSLEMFYLETPDTKGIASFSLEILNLMIKKLNISEGI